MSQQDSRQSASTTAIHLMINGARGRMGASIARLARDDPRFVIASLRDVGDDEALRDSRDGSSLANAATTRKIDAVIDFSSDAGTRDACHLALDHHAAILVGTTALTQATREALACAAKTIPVLIAANTSLGVAVLARLAADAARMLGLDFTVRISETHHTMKKDAPSGTALRLAKAVRERGGPLGESLRDSDIESIRVGEVIGDHTIEFTSAGERIAITHSAINRDLFARGALQAVEYLAHKPPGAYTIEQALGVA